MALIIGTILALLSIAVAVYPFIRLRRLKTVGDANGPVNTEGRLNVDADSAGLDSAELDSIYDAIRTLQLERELGSIPEGLYREQFNDYRHRAAVALREQVRLQSQSQPQPQVQVQVQNVDTEWALEEEIQVARAGLRRGNVNWASCPNCAFPVREEADRCPECNIDLSSQTGRQPRFSSNTASGPAERD